MTDAPDTVNWTTDPVDLPGTDPADPPTELVPGRLWHGGCPVDFGWVREAGIDLVVDLADADAYPPASEVEGLTYLKCPLVDGDTLPDPALTLRLAALVAGLVDDGYQALVHCTFGRNRSGLVATLVVRELLGLSGQDALAHVRDLRDRAVNNEDFARWLASLPAPGDAAPGDAAPGDAAPGDAARGDAARDQAQSGVRHSRSAASSQSSGRP